MTTTKAKPVDDRDKLAALRSRLADMTEDTVRVRLDGSMSLEANPVFQVAVLRRCVAKILALPRGLGAVRLFALYDYTASGQYVTRLRVLVGPCVYTWSGGYSGANATINLYLPSFHHYHPEESAPMTTSETRKPKRTPKAAPVVAVEASPVAPAPPPAPPPSAVVVRETLREALASNVARGELAPKPASGYYTTRSEYRGAPMLCVHDARGEVVLQFQARKAKALAACASEIAAFAAEV